MAERRRCAPCRRQSGGRHRCAHRRDHRGAARFRDRAMIRLLVLLIALGCVAMGAAWLANHSGEFLLTIPDYEIHTSATVAIALMLLFVIALFVLLRLSVAVAKTPGWIGGWYAARRARQG